MGNDWQNVEQNKELKIRKRYKKGTTTSRGKIWKIQKSGVGGITPPPTHTLTKNGYRVP